MLATLKYPVMGYTGIKLIIKRKNKWLAELVGVDLEIEVSVDDFTRNNEMNDDAESEQVILNKRQSAYLMVNNF